MRLFAVLLDGVSVAPCVDAPFLRLGDDRDDRRFKRVGPKLHLHDEGFEDRFELILREGVDRVGGKEVEVLPLDSKLNVPVPLPVPLPGVRNAPYLQKVSHLIYKKATHVVYISGTGTGTGTGTGMGE